MDQIQKLNELTSLLEAQNNKVKELIEEMEGKKEEPKKVFDIKRDGFNSLTVWEHSQNRIEITYVSDTGIYIVVYKEEIPQLIQALKYFQEEEE